MRLPTSPAVHPLDQYSATLKAALWDMDGTLVDTEPYWIAAEMELVRAHGGSWGTAESHALVGFPLEESAAVLQRAGVEMSVRDIVEFLSARVAEGIRREIPWRPGARELLEELHGRGVRCALVTMSEGPLAHEVINALPAPYFEFMVTGDQVENGKPHPEPYLRAVELLRAADPSLTVADCVAFEDSVPGVASARAANVTTIAVPHIVPLPEDPSRVTWATLAGAGYDDVARVFAARGTDAALAGTGAGGAGAGL
ncbi:HAD family hydrolase [Specibacter sp. RAF43]|uniref:HAD family hydrolase n=1 Tax=Specibacter sp. RAF43 TaxID=3233057 RepID=UPI003F9BF611